MSSEIVVHGDDLKEVRLYCRLAAAMSALTLVLLAFFVIWISTRLFGWHWDSPRRSLRSPWSWSRLL